MNHRLVLSLAAVAAVLAAPRLAAAQDAAPFGERSPWVLTADGIAGYAVEHVSVESQSSGSGITFSGPDEDTKYAGFLAGTTLVPRIGLHRFLGGGLSVGAGIHYSTISASDMTWFAFAPRVGYAIPVGPTTAIWLRGGVTYLSQSVQNGQFSLWSLDPAAEALVVLAPTPHFGVTIGPFVELGATGKVNVEVPSFSLSGATTRSFESDAKLTFYGLAAGLLTDF